MTDPPPVVGPENDLSPSRMAAEHAFHGEAALNGRDWEGAVWNFARAAQYAAQEHARHSGEHQASIHLQSSIDAR